jgi:hypothetical protein
MSSSSLPRKSHIAHGLLKKSELTLTIIIFNCIQSRSVFNRINASGFSFVRVLMFVQHTPVGSCFSL